MSKSSPLTKSLSPSLSQSLIEQSAKPKPKRIIKNLTKSPLGIASRERNWHKGAVRFNAMGLIALARKYNVVLKDRVLLPKGMPVEAIIDSLSTLMRSAMDAHVEKIRLSTPIDKEPKAE